MLHVQHSLLIHMSGTWAEMADWRLAEHPTPSLHVASLSFLRVHIWQLASPRGNTTLRVTIGAVVHGWVHFGDRLPQIFVTSFYSLWSYQRGIFLYEPFLEEG